MHSRFLRHLTKHNALSTEHYGFRTKLNTDSATYKLATEILNVMEDVHVKLNPGLPWQKLHSARRRLFLPANWT